MNDFNAVPGADFLLIGTKIRALYEKNDQECSILLIPSERNDNNEISMRDMICDIQKMIVSIDSKIDRNVTQTMEEDLIKRFNSLVNGKFDASEMHAMLRFECLNLQKAVNEYNGVLEYMFELEVPMYGFIPEKIRNIMDVTSLSLSIWSANRKKLVDVIRQAAEIISADQQ